MWQGRRARAFVPALLAERDLGLTAESMRRTAAAAAEVNLSAAGMPADYEPLSRLLLRAEGVASSYIEGMRAPLIDVVLAESTSGGHTPAAWVAANLAAVTEAVAAAGIGGLVRGAALPLASDGDDRKPHTRKVRRRGSR